VLLDGVLVACYGHGYTRMWSVASAPNGCLLPGPAGAA
jgi:hypothetical protein